MAISSIRRRVRKLETLPRFLSRLNHLPFTGAEIQAIANRIVEGDDFTGEEVARMHRHTPLMHGECLITAYNGNIFMKRYLGIDVLRDI